MTLLLMVITTIHAYLQAQHHQIHDLVQFYECKQEEGETFDSFLCALHKIAANCDLDKMMVDRHFMIRIINGIPGPDICRKLLLLHGDKRRQVKRLT